MNRYRDTLLPTPVRLHTGRGRPIEFPAAVLDGQRIIAVFDTEGRARAYAHRLNKLMEVKV